MEEELSGVFQTFLDKPLLHVIFKIQDKLDRLFAGMVIIVMRSCGNGGRGVAETEGAWSL